MKHTMCETKDIISVKSEHIYKKHKIITNIKRSNMLNMFLVDDITYGIDSNDLEESFSIIILSHFVASKNLI